MLRGEKVCWDFVTVILKDFLTIVCNITIISRQHSEKKLFKIWEFLFWITKMWKDMSWEISLYLIVLFYISIFLDNYFTYCLELQLWAIHLITASGFESWLIKSNCYLVKDSGSKALSGSSVDFSQNTHHKSKSRFNSSASTQTWKAKQGLCFPSWKAGKQWSLDSLTG